MRATRPDGADNPMARVITIAGTLVVMGIIQVIAPNIPGIKEIRLGPGSLGDWISLVLVPAMAIVSLGFLKPGRDYCVHIIRENYQSSATVLRMEPQWKAAITAVILILVLILSAYFAQQSMSNPILAGFKDLEKIIHIVTALCGLIALIILTVNLLKIVKQISAKLTESLGGGGGTSKKCPKCGKEATLTEVFCSACGERIG